MVQICFRQGISFQYQFQVAEKLIEAGAKLNEGNAHGLIPLHLAVQNGFNEMTSLLVQNGADLNHQVRRS